MPDRQVLRPADEQDMRMATGAYDQIHHAHGYAWAPERHHWYWFAGIAASAVLGIAGLALYVMFDLSMAPLCARSDSVLAVSPDGTRTLETVMVSCGGGEPSRKVLIYDTGGSANVPAVASFDEAADVRVRWTSDAAVRVSKTGGRIWDSQLNWRDVRLHYDVH